MPAPSRLERRLEDAFRAFLAASALPALAAWSIRERDDDKPVAPQGKAPPKPIIVLTARDGGRAHKLTPIRKLSLEVTFHANGLTPAGSAGALDAAVGALEHLLDTTNLQTALSRQGIAVMLARRDGDSSIHFDGLVRRAAVRLNANGVAVELTTAG